MSTAYPHYQRPCCWPDPAFDGAVKPALTGHQHFDAIIIGAGYTGLAIARRLAERQPNYRIAVLEAEQVGSGSPGRNSGFALETALSAPSAAQAQQLHTLYQRAHTQLITAAGLSDTSTQPVFKAAATSRGERYIKQLERFMAASGQPAEWLDAAALAQITGSTYYRSGLLLPGNRLLNPVRTIRAVAQTLPANVTLYENSAVLELEQHASRWVVRTASAIAEAPRLFLANNAFIKGLGYGASRSVTIYTYAGLTPILSDAERAQINQRGEWGLLPAHRLGTTFRSTQDGRLLVRGMYGYEQEGGDEVEQILLRSLHSRYPELEGAQQLAHWWGGTTSLTANGAPLWGELRPGLFASVGCNGVGLVKGWMLGGALADLATGVATIPVHELFGQPSWMPPEPFRQLGFLAVSTLEKQLAGGEI